MMDEGLVPVEKSGSRQDPDGFEQTPSSPNAAAIRNAVSGRRREELEETEPAGPVSQFLLMFLGLNTTRRISNLCKSVGFGGFLKPIRVYPTISAQTELKFCGQSVLVSELAASLKPKFFTINEERTKKPSLRPTEVRYEMLPSKKMQNHYSIIYYVKAPDEDMPIPILGKLYDYVRPILWGSKADWEAIQIDINKQSGEPQSLVFESSNYTDKPASYFSRTSSDLHLRCEVKKTGDDTWEHTLIQKDGKRSTTEVPDPFSEGRPDFAFVSWNGGFDLTSRLKQMGYGKGEKLLDELEDPAFSELDLDTFQAEGFDLRAGWLADRKSVALAMPLEQGV